jgi:hypothetical protein
MLACTAGAGNRLFGPLLLLLLLWLRARYVKQVLSCVQLLMVSWDIRARSEHATSNKLVS